MREIPENISNYRVGLKLGQGGMGSVYRCSVAKNGDGTDEYAIKFLSTLDVSDSEAQQRFLRECETLEKLQHPHVLQLLDHGISDGLPYLVSELCIDRYGRPFSLRLFEHEYQEGLEVRLLERLFPQVLWALAYIHQDGIVHRDIKPANVLVHENRFGQYSARLADFGLASVTIDPQYMRKDSWIGDRDEAHLVGRGFSGTYDYMSPEQVNGEAVDARSDVFSFGVMLYRAATGYDRLTFRRPSQVRPGVPRWVDDIVLASVAPDREDRCENALELLFLLPDHLRPAGVQRSAAY